MLDWDRLLETCYRRGATDLLIVADALPHVRLKDGWRTVLLNDPPDAADIARLVGELASEKEPTDHGGYHYIDFTYAQTIHFRALALGYPEPRAIIVSRTI